MRKLSWVILLATAPAWAQITLDAPASIQAGGVIEITWQGGEDPKDFVTIVKKGEAEGKYKKYKYARAKKWKTAVPEEVGDYEIRYLAAAAPYKTLASRPISITAVSAEVSAPASVSAGSRFPVNWTGPANPQDFITIVKVGTPDRKYGKYVYTRKGSPLNLVAPEEAGDYEVRYLTGQKYFTLATTPIKVEATTATVKGPNSVKAGARFEVVWTGPDNHQDYVTIVEAGAKEGRYLKYVYTRKGSPLTLPAPDTPGQYEIRYVTGGKGRTLASMPITVGAVSASVSVPEQVDAGALFDVAWTGPNNPQDYVTIVKEGAPDRSYTKYKYTRGGTPLKLPAPEDPGSYEVRYLTGDKGFVLARTPIKVVSVTATLQAPESVTAGERFQVNWTGPDNPRDFISMVLLSEPENEWPAYSYTHRGNPANLTAPLKPGDYELRYRTGRNYYILATQAIRVEPANRPPGRLEVLNPASHASLTLPKGAAVELILDASGSMLKRLSGKRRIDIAKEVLTDLVSNKLAEGTPFALRVFGHREADSCRTDLEIPLAPLDKQKALALIKGVGAKNKAKTPIGASLEQVAQDLAGASDQSIVLLVTDGEETCEGDPAAVIEALKAQGLDLRINIIGFAIDETELKQTFRLWANLGGGSYFDAGSAEALNASLVGALKTPFDVLNAAGDIVGEGLMGGEAIVLPEGTYSVRTRETPPRARENIKVPSGKLSSVTVK